MHYRIFLNFIKETSKIFFNKKRSHKPAESSIIENIFKSHSANVIIVHAGLSAIKRTFPGKNPYILLWECLSSNYKSIIVPAFTSSFRITGIYHKLFSRPETGKFAELSMLEKKYTRTNDCIHNFFLFGDYHFNDCDHFSTFGDKSCFHKIDADNILYVNIGTAQLTCTQFHYIEDIAQLPYIGRIGHKGVIYYNEKDYAPVEQISYLKKNRFSAWNREKIAHDLKSAGVLSRYNINGLIIEFFGARDLRCFIEKKVKKNPYYLIT